MFKIKVGSHSNDQRGNRCHYLILLKDTLFRWKQNSSFSREYNIYYLKWAVIKSLHLGLTSTLPILLTVVLSSTPVRLSHHGLSSVAPSLTVPPPCPRTPARLISPPFIYPNSNLTLWMTPSNTRPYLCFSISQSTFLSSWYTNFFLTHSFVCSG